MTFRTPSRSSRLKIASLVCGLALLIPVAAALSRSTAVDTAKASGPSVGVVPTSPLSDDGLHW